MPEERKNLKTQPFFYLVMVAVAVLGYLVLSPFFAVIVLAFLTALFFRPVYDYFHSLFGTHIGWAAGLSVVIVFFAILIPLISIGWLTAQQVVQFSQDLSGTGSVDVREIVDRANTVLETIPGLNFRFSVEELSQYLSQFGRSLGSFIVERLPNIGASAFNAFTAAFVFVVLLFTFFPLQTKLMEFVKRLSPLDDRIDTVYVTRILEMSKSMVKGTFLIALVQGVVSGIFLAIAGVDYVLFWTMLMVFLGVIPMFGAGIIAFPVGIVLFITGNWVGGLIVILSQILIVSNIDNIMRPRLVSKKASLHPALVLLGVLGGLQVFGVLGFIYGPVVMILLVTTYEVYRKYFHPEPAG